MSIENRALRIITGAFPTTPIESLHSLVGEKPLQERVILLSLLYATKTSANPKNSNYCMTFSNRFQSIYNQNSNIIPPLYERITRFMQQINYSIPQTILPLSSSNVAPWTLPPIKINTELSTYNKKDTHALILQSVFHEILNTVQPNPEFVYYTDASMKTTETGVGAAVVTPSGTYQFRLPEGCSVYTGELFAIYQSLITIMNCNNKNSYVICTDSLSSLSSIKQLYPENPLCQQIQQILSQLLQLQINVEFIYVPSHIGIPGNEKADRAAQDALSSPTIQTTETFIHLDLVKLVKRKVTEKQQERWNNNSAHLRNIKPKIIGSLTLPENRKDQVVISRLRLGHTRLTHSYLLSREDRPVCETCHGNITVKHLLTECPKYQQARENLQIGHIKEALGNNPQQLKNTIKFLKCTDLYSNI